MLPKVSNSKQDLKNIIFNMQLTNIISFLFYSLNLLMVVAAFEAVQQGIDHELFLKNLFTSQTLPSENIIQIVNWCK